ncbi:uncharacterized protein LOC135935104 [Cloeon dipterum]|uniref:uncharacterized protein LOC135935104 n=1 Tax=Cloeon dipterum TaxID=197152 RepID=UPI003220856B
MAEMRLLAIVAAFLYLAKGCQGMDCFRSESSNLMCFEENACNSTTLRLVSSGSSELEDRAFLHFYNKLRQMVALGKVPGHPPARNMLQLVWVKEFQRHMLRLAQQCMDPAAVRAAANNIHGFNSVQNDAQVVAGLYAHPLEQDDAMQPLDDLMDGVFRLAVCENRFPLSAIRCFDHDHFANAHDDAWLSHWAMVIYDKADAIGCSKSLFQKIGPDEEYLSYLPCYIAPALDENTRRLYKAGEPDCEHPSKVYPGLCTTPQVNKKSVDPCTQPDFRKQFRKLCKNRFFTDFCSGVPSWLIWVAIAMGGTLSSTLFAALAIVYWDYIVYLFQSAVALLVVA